MNARAALPLLAIPLLLTAGCASHPTSAPTAPVAAAPTPTPAPAPPPATAAPSAATPADVARRAEFDAALNRWHGASLAELQSKMGKPTSVVRGSSGRSTYAYTRTTAADPGTGVARFRCTVRYVVDDKTRLVQSHQIEGC
jgi:hypothetical protein